MLYRLIYLLKNKFGWNYKLKDDCPPSQKLKFIGTSKSITSKVISSSQFEFLNLKKEFKNEVDWNYSKFGKLWTYNLNYFEFLHQESLKFMDKVDLLGDYIENDRKLKDGIEPYPTSLRILNWIRFFSRHQDLDSSKFDIYLFSHTAFLRRRLEFHILGNHLLENAFALLMAAYYFDIKSWHDQARKLLIKQIEEQILRDGAHFERSPMYHKIIFYRVLEAIDLIKNNGIVEDKNLHLQLVKAAKRMRSWLSKVTFSNGEVPHVNDSTDGISLKTEALLNYGDLLGIEPEEKPLSESGFRLWRQNDLEVFLNIGGIGPSYQPGHAHADTLSFILHHKGAPIIVDTGTSTYQKDEKRQLERSTSSHNTVVYNDLNSSEVWGGFRVGRRAKTNILKEKEFGIEVKNLGYKHLGLEHLRSFDLNQNTFVVCDKLIGKISKKAKTYLHFHPECELKLENDQLIVNHFLKIKFEGFNNLWLENYFFAKGFNNTIEAKKLCGEFNANTKMIIEYYEN